MMCKPDSLCFLVSKCHGAPITGVFIDTVIRSSTKSVSFLPSSFLFLVFRAWDGGYHCYIISEKTSVHTANLYIFLVYAWLALKLSTEMMRSQSAGPFSWQPEPLILFAPTPITPVPSYHRYMVVVTKGSGNSQGNLLLELEK